MTEIAKEPSIDLMPRVLNKRTDHCGWCNNPAIGYGKLAGSRPPIDRVKVCSKHEYLVIDFTPYEQPGPDDC